MKKYAATMFAWYILSGCAGAVDASEVYETTAQTLSDQEYEKLFAEYNAQHVWGKLQKLKQSQEKEFLALNLSKDLLTVSNKGDVLDLVCDFILENKINVQFFDLSNNELSELSKKIGNLEQLQALNISNNGLSELPEEIGELTHLEWLLIANNQLSELPEWIGQFSKLSRLYFGGNKQIILPEWLGQLTHLRDYGFSHN